MKPTRRTTLGRLRSSDAATFAIAYTVHIVSWCLSGRQRRQKQRSCALIKRATALFSARITHARIQSKSEEPKKEEKKEEKKAKDTEEEKKLGSLAFALVTLVRFACIQKIHFACGAFGFIRNGCMSVSTSLLAASLGTSFAFVCRLSTRYRISDIRYRFVLESADDPQIYLKSQDILPTSLPNKALRQFNAVPS